MRNTYGFRFLLSPSNPRNDMWIGQAFGLSYLNSQPGNSYLFRYKPYWAADSTPYNGPLLADRGEKTGGEIRTTVFGKRNISKEGFNKSPVEYVIRRKMEALFSRGFTANLESATALVVEWVQASPTGKDAWTDLITLAHRVEEKQNMLKLQGTNGHRIQINEDALVIAEMMIGHIRRINNPEALVGSLTFADRDQRIHTSMLTLGWTRAVNEKEAILPDMKLGSRPDPEAIFFTHDKTAFRPNVIHDAIDHVMYFGERTHYEGVASLMPVVAETPTKTGITGKHLNGTPIDDREGIRNELLFGFKEDAEAIIREQLTFANEPDTYGILYDVYNFEKFHSQHARVDWEQTHASSEIRKNSQVDYEYVGVEIMKNGSARIDREMINAYGAGTQQGMILDTGIKRVDYGGFNAWVEFGHQFFNGPDSLPTHGLILEQRVLTEKVYQQARDNGIDVALIEGRVPGEARVPWVEIMRTEKLPLPGGNVYVDTTRVEKLQKDTWHQTMSDIQKADEKIRYTGWDPEVGIELIERDHQNGRVVEDASVRTNKQGVDSRSWSFVNTMVDSMPLDVRIMEEASVKVNKVQMAARIVEMLSRVDIVWKAVMVLRNWDFVEKLDHNAQLIRYMYAERGGEQGEEDKQAIILGLELLRKAEKESLINPSMAVHLLADKQLLDGLMMKLINFERPDAQALITEFFMSDRTPGNDPGAIVMGGGMADAPQIREVIEQGGLTAERDLEKLKGIIGKLIISHQVEEQRPAYIPVERYMLVGDISDWDDIWNNYSPGVDVLDVPDSDYDYSNLANRVYDPETGVPLKPLGPTNKPDVKVELPLHHPVPSNAEIGIGPTVVDNYVLMDVILAVESLKNRNKLRFAGMPAEKTIRELLAKLYAWVQQSAPGVFEYERTFRFVRWYGEAAVTKLSKHILQRVYNPWLSSIHNNGDLGVPYTSTGWSYMPNASVIQTTAQAATITFQKDNYIDGEITVRGYFDNPLREGTMEVKVDGTTIAQLTNSDNGAFTLKAEVPAGHHKYEIVFTGLSGRVSLSSLEITGCVFVSATTTADDSDTNGLKACSTLMQMLLLYFERHHGSGKIKGTMAIKQRGLWNQT